MFKKLFSSKFRATFLLILFVFSIILTTSLSVTARDFKSENKQVRGDKVGQFILGYKPTSNYQEIRQFLSNSEVFERVITNLNNSGLIMRQDIPVNFQECGTPNAYWNPSDQNIIICYEMMDYSLKYFQQLGYSDDKILDRSIKNSIFIFYHELGHALIDILPLNAVGQEEDTVDEFASIMMYREYSPETASEIVLSASEFFAATDALAWGVHSPGDRRLFNLTCYVFGSNPEKYQQIFVERLIVLNGGVLPDKQKILSRADKCLNGFAQKRQQWNKLLLPHYANINRSQPSNLGNYNPPNNGNVSTPGKYW